MAIFEVLESQPLFFGSQPALFLKEQDDVLHGRLACEFLRVGFRMLSSPVKLPDFKLGSVLQVGNMVSAQLLNTGAFVQA